MDAATAPEKSPLAEALAKLDAAMRRPMGSSADPDRRRVAARLADLVRCEDDELTAFASRHLLGRAADEAALRAAREMLLAIGGVLGPEGESAEALDVLKDAHRVLEERLAEAKRAAERRAAEEAAAKRAAEEASATTGAPALVEAEGPLSRLSGGLPFVAAASMAAPAPMAVPVPAPVAAPAPMAVPVPAPVAAPAPVAEPEPVPEPSSTPAPQSVTQPAIVPGPEPTSVPRTEPPVSGAESKPAGNAIPETGRIVDPALPFIQVASDERPRPTVARFDAALPFQPVASPDGPPPREPAAAPVQHAPASPRHNEHHPVADAQGAAAASVPPAVASSALPAAAPSVPPASTPAPASAGDALSARPPPSLTLNQYAGLVVACELYPAYVESTNARYGVPTPAARAALDAFWAGRFAADPALAQRWPELCDAARWYFLQSR